jgi:DNA-directed RNA polymerase specialized sigma24 family protein
MAVSEELLRRAQNDDRAAMEALLSDVYPSVYRIAHALTGRPGEGRRVIHGVLHRSLRVMPEWRVGVIPENWYYHHTVLRSRDFSARPPDPRHDLLVAGAGGAASDPGYVAFVRALRNLPGQQAESFILHHGEKLNDRLLGVAMDCSVRAAAQHLDAAAQALAAVSGEKLGAYTRLLSTAYHAATPPPETIQPVARHYAVRALRPKRLRRVIRIIILLALIAAAYFAWRERGHWLPLARDAKARWWDMR